MLNCSHLKIYTRVRLMQIHRWFLFTKNKLYVPLSSYMHPVDSLKFWSFVSGMEKVFTSTAQLFLSYCLVQCPSAWVPGALRVGEIEWEGRGRCEKMGRDQCRCRNRNAMESMFVTILPLIGYDNNFGQRVVGPWRLRTRPVARRYEWGILELQGGINQDYNL